MKEHASNSPESEREEPARRPDQTAAQPAARVLAMQQAAGNRATAQMVSRWPTFMDYIFGPREPSKYPATASIFGEDVIVKNKTEFTDAVRIIKEVPEKYGIDVSSARSMKALKSRLDDAPKEMVKELKYRPWLYKELAAVERALKHYAPILGSKRKSSSRKDIDQEVVSVGKLDTKLGQVGDEWKWKTSVMGEYFSETKLKAFTMYKHGETATPDFSDIDKQMEATAVHEMAHGIFRSSYDAWVKQFGYWKDQDTKSGAADMEAPPTDYGKTNAREDLCESVMLYFVDRKRLEDGNGATAGSPGNKCPQRAAFIDTLVGAWKPAKTDSKAKVPA